MISREIDVSSDSLAVSIFEEEQQLSLEFPSKDTDFELKKSKRLSIDTDNLYRPIQYLGAKYRPLPIILSKTIEAIIPETFVLDLFSGSTLVSQIFNSHGLNVISNDVLQFNSAFSSALLNIERQETDLERIPLAIVKLQKFKLNNDFTIPFENKIIEEKKLLTAKNTEQLLKLYFGLPQVSKVLFLNGSNTHQQTKFILENIGQAAFNKCPLIANYYAGSYFSINQALELDRLRNGIEFLYTIKEISNWQYHFLLTCLLSVSSKIVYTAGKHFAQPIKPENTLKTDVLHKRFYEDRLKNVWDEFLKSSDALSLTCEKNYLSKTNIALSKTMEDIISDTSLLPPVSVIYADPPYTAQQYSRYYHIPEIIFNYKYPQLQVVDGKVTSGLYPDDKFKSRFCSKREAYFAFTDLFKLAEKLKSSLIISYSSSLSEETGNLRMIGLEQIKELGNRYLPTCKSELLKFNFQYRQLNTAKKIIQSKNDKEFLIFFKQPST